MNRATKWEAGVSSYHAPMPLRMGEKFAGYRVLRLLGSGGMGEVYLVEHPRLPRQEALKILHSDLSSDSSFQERFIREADLTAGLRHPHIVGVHDRGEHDGHLWIAMDYIDGVDAAHLLKQRYPAGMPMDLAVRITSGVGSALDYAHKKGLLHRDVKPANILIADLDSEAPNIYLADFGIARSLDDTSGITTTNMTVGTVAYAAPEQLMGEPMNGRADQYALAATTYQLLTGSQLFPNSNPAVVISRHLNAPVPALSDSRPELAALDPVLAVALAKSPDDRFPRCADFARTLAEEAVATRGEASPTAPTRPSPASPKVAIDAPPSVRKRAPNPTSRSRRWWWAATALLVAVLSIAAVFGMLKRSSHQQQESTPLAQPSATATTAAPTTAATTSSQHAITVTASPTPTATTQVPQGDGYALTGCYYNPDSPPVDRPTNVGLFFCASGGMSVDDMSWTSWGPYGADGTGIAHFRVCQPSCAQGYEVPTPVVIHAWNPLPSPGNSECPRDVRFFADMILAFPNDEPPLEANMPALSRYNGMPAIRYTSYSDPGPPIQVMGPPSCY